MRISSPLLRLHLGWAIALLASGAAALPAAPLKKAAVTRVVNDVKLLPEQKSPVPAKIGDEVTGKTAVTTGVKSRAELNSKIARSPGWDRIRFSPSSKARAMWN